MKLIILATLLITLTACGKLGVTGTINQELGNWAQVNVPDGCVPKQIAAEGNSGVVMLCEDGRVFLQYYSLLTYAS